MIPVKLQQITIKEQLDTAAKPPKYFVKLFIFDN